MNPLQEITPLQQIYYKLLTEKGVELWIKRDDLIHPEISGNKWRKLKFNLYNARLNGYTTLLTFGGPYSNHIYATSAAAKLFHFRAIGIIRGEQPEHKSSTLRFAADKGMELHYMDRAMYRMKDDPAAIESLHAQIGKFYHIPEGGTNIFALEGVEEMIDQITAPFDVVCTSCGTGGTLAGIVSALKGRNRALGFSALKGEDTLTDKINQLTKDYCGQVYSNFSILDKYHFGGYAKVNQTLVDFIKTFRISHDIQLDPVYTGKMIFGLFDCIRNDYFTRGTRIVAIHTGGLQGLQGYPEFFPEFKDSFLG